MFFFKPLVGIFDLEELLDIQKKIKSLFKNTYSGLSKSINRYTKRVQCSLLLREALTVIDDIGQHIHEFKISIDDSPVSSLNINKELIQQKTT